MEDAPVDDAPVKMHLWMIHLWMTRLWKMHMQAHTHPYPNHPATIHPLNKAAPHQRCHPNRHEPHPAPFNPHLRSHHRHGWLLTTSALPHVIPCHATTHHTTSATTLTHCTCPPPAGNDLSSVFAPLIRDGRMDKFYWNPTRDDLTAILHQVGGLVCGWREVCAP